MIDLFPNTENPFGFHLEVHRQGSQHTLINPGASFNQIENIRIRRILYALLLIAITMTFSGCSTFGTRDLDRDTRVNHQAKIKQQPTAISSDSTQVWVPLLPPNAPIRTTPNHGTGSQLNGLATVIQEVDAVIRLVDTVSRMPASHSRLTVNFGRIQADLALVRTGLIEAIMQPSTAPREWPPVSGDYRGG
ncbi:MAG: RAQPRD family integrative conjugative element protein [Gammaproteobacteria bacterium]|nr:RAQPRD family integrative conjugative element protein [Gammaproteobacteria bacterium]